MTLTFLFYFCYYTFTDVIKRVAELNSNVRKFNRSQAMDYINSFSTAVNNVTAISTRSTNEYPYSGPRWSFWGIFQLTIIIIGTGANITWLVLLVKENGKKTSNTVLVGAVAANDITIPIFWFLFEMLYTTFKYDITSTSVFACKFVYFMKNSMSLMPGWFVLALTTERLISVYFPQMIKLFSRRMTGISITICIVCASLFLKLHFLLQIDLYPIQWLGDGTIIYTCTSEERQYLEFIGLIDKFVSPISAGILPGLCILVENVFLIKALCQSLTAPSSTRRQISSENRTRLVFTIMIGIMFLFMDMPYYVIEPFYFESGTQIDNVNGALWLLSHSVKCFVYVCYKRNVRTRCIVCKTLLQSDDIL